MYIHYDYAVSLSSIKGKKTLQIAMIGKVVVTHPSGNPVLIATSRFSRGQKKTITVHWNLPIHWCESCEILKQQCLSGGFLTPKSTVVRCLPYDVWLYSLSLPSTFFLYGGLCRWNS